MCCASASSRHVSGQEASATDEELQARCGPLPSPIYCVCGPKFTYVKCAVQELVITAFNVVFILTILLLRSADICDQD